MRLIKYAASYHTSLLLKTEIDVIRLFSIFCSRPHSDHDQGRRRSVYARHRRVGHAERARHVQHGARKRALHAERHLQGDGRARLVSGRAGHPAEARRRQAEVRRNRVRRKRGMRKHPSFYDKRLISETRPVR